MLIDRQQVLDVLVQYGTPDQLAQASQLLPPQVEPTQLASIVQQIGIDPGILSGLTGLDMASIAQAASGDLGGAEGLLGKLRSLFGG